VFFREFKNTTKKVVPKRFYKTTDKKSKTDFFWASVFFGLKGSLSFFFCQHHTAQKNQVLGRFSVRGVQKHHKKY
jgi:hypothetical protein